MKNKIQKTKIHLQNKEYSFSLLTSIFFILVSLAINFLASTYATKQASNSVTDIVLSNIPVFDVYFIFNYGVIVIWAIAVFVSFKHPRRVPFVLKSLALFIIIRSIFISLTHIAAFPTNIIGSEVGSVSFQNDLFFSGHTGVPFLLALVYWQYKNIRYSFLTCSIFFGIIALLGHIHYTIDVLGAFFITYSIFHLSEFLFKKDRHLFHNGIKNL